MERDDKFFQFLMLMDICNKISELLLEDDDEEDFDNEEDKEYEEKWEKMTDESYQKTIEKYGGNKMYFSPPTDYDKIMKQVPYGKIITVSEIRNYFAKVNNADFTEPMTAGIFINIVAWASFQRNGKDETPYWHTLKANGELNPKYP